MSFVKETLETRLSSCQKRLVLLLNGNQYRNLCFAHKTTYLWSMRSPSGAELSLSACPGMENRRPSEKKMANSRGFFLGVGWQ